MMVLRGNLADGTRVSEHSGTYLGVRFPNNANVDQDIPFSIRFDPAARAALLGGNRTATTNGAGTTPANNIFRITSATFGSLNLTSFNDTQAGAFGFTNDSLDFTINPNELFGTSNATVSPGQLTYAVFSYIPAGGTSIIPADRCTWHSDYSANDKNYEVFGAHFFPGHDSPIEILNPELGYIGKSGRFVKIAN